MVLKKCPLPLFVHVTSRNGPYILHMLHKNFTRWKQFKFFILSGNLLLRASRPTFHSINCLKLFDFTLSFVYTLKLLKGPLSHIFCFILKNIWLTPELAAPEWFISFLNKTIQKKQYESLKEGPGEIFQKGGPETTALFAFPNIHPCSQLHTKERTGFIL